MFDKIQEDKIDYYKIPVSETDEYIYNIDFAYCGDSDLMIEKIEKYKIVENVRTGNNLKYYFNFKDDESKKLYYICYRWAFVRNTENNRILLRLRDERRRIIEQLDDISDREFKEIFKNEYEYLKKGE